LPNQATVLSKLAKTLPETLANHVETVAELLSITEEPVRLDSQAKYATVARGEADI